MTSSLLDNVEHWRERAMAVKREAERIGDGSGGGDTLKNQRRGGTDLQ
ncbi:MAG TPA: hypothetical protein VI009_08135 [Xanthobacteraceae bacterium]